MAMPLISAAIMAHPKREAYVADLVRTVGIETVVWDEHDDRWDTGRRALLAHSDATHHLVLQDDAVAHPDLMAACDRIVAHVPVDVPVSLYMGRYRITPHRFPMEVVARTAEAQHASFAAFGGPWWGVGLIIPTAHIRALVAFGDAASHPNYDIRIAQYFKREGLACYYTMPSIVDHRVGPSLVGRSGQKRHAQSYHQGSPLELAWDGKVITPDMLLRLGQRFPVTP